MAEVSDVRQNFTCMLKTEGYVISVIPVKAKAVERS
jgi:hypothetical protein